MCQYKIFNWYSIFDNNLTLNGDIYLKDECHSYVYTPDSKKMFWHKHILWFSNYHINRMNFIHHFYIDGAFVTTKDYYQLIVICITI